jgi:hypothetical protein
MLSWFRESGDKSPHSIRLTPSPHFNPKTAIAFGTPFANPSALAHCPLRSTNHKVRVRLGKVQCAPARSLCEIRPKPIAVFGFKSLPLPTNH